MILVRLLALALTLAACGGDKNTPDTGPAPDRGIFEGPVTKKDPDQGPVPDWVLAMRERGVREASPADGRQ